MKKLTRFFAALLVLTMTIGTISVFAAEETTEKQTLKIGIATCFSGNAAKSAESQLNGLLVAMNQVEAQGLSKYYDFELYQGDDKFDATEAVSVANKLVYQDGVKVVFGHLAAFVTLAGVGVYEEAHIPCFTPTCSSVQLIEGGYQYVYMTVPHDRISAASMVNYLLDDLGKEKIGVLYCDNEQGQSGFTFLQSAMDERGLSFAATETYTVEDTDYTGQMLNFKAAGIDALLIWGGDSSRRPIMIDQVRQYLGSEVTISGDNYFADAAFYDQTTPEDRAGIVYPAAWSEDFTDDLSVQYAADYRALAPDFDTVGAVTVRFYDAFYMLVEALNAMGPYDVNADDFTEKLNEAIKGVSIEGLQGTLTPQEDGECVMQSHIVMYGEDGFQKFVK